MVFSLSPTEFNKILYLVKKDDELFYSIKDKDFFYKRKEIEPRIARAYYKIKEIVLENNLDIKNKTILDIGAAPGGWSEYLKNYAKQIIAIDPAKLEIQDYKIIHFQEKLEDVIEKVNQYGYEIIICDINQEFEKVMESIFKLNYKNKILIITLKFSRRSNNYVSKRIKEIYEFIKPYSENAKIKWLFANTQKERTLICKFN